MENLRVIEKKVDDAWIRTRMEDLSKGDTFRMFDDEEKTIAVHNAEMVAESNPRPVTNEHGEATTGIEVTIG